MRRHEHTQATTSLSRNTYRIRLDACLALAAVSAFGGCTCSGASPGVPPLSKADAANTCAILEACFPGEWDGLVWSGSLAYCTSAYGSFYGYPTPGNLGTQRVTTGMEGPTADIYRCVLAAGGDCAKAAACFAPGGGGACTTTDGGSLAKGSCSGKKLAGCSAEGQDFGIDCGSYDEVCGSLYRPFLLDAKVCGLASCSDRSTDRCEGDVAVTCGDGSVLHADSVMVRTDCARYGATCFQASGGGAGCKGAGTCDPNGQPYCNGSVLTGCGPNGGILRYDCASQPTMRRCLHGECEPTGTACDYLTPVTCDGTSIHFCQDGSPASVDCAALGFAGCKDGRCLPTHDGSACATGWTSCPTGCVETGTDPANCGGCGIACEPGKLCMDGKCFAADCRATDCGPGSRCDKTDWECVPSCNSDGDCFPDHVCYQSTCQACPVGQTEVEPNDSQASPQLLSPSATGGQPWGVDGVICPTADVDWYEIDLPKGGSITWEASAWGGSISVSFTFGGQTTPPVTCDGNQTCQVETLFVGTGPQTLYVEVQGSTAPVTYDLAVTQP